MVTAHRLKKNISFPDCAARRALPGPSLRVCAAAGSVHLQTGVAASAATASYHVSISPRTVAFHLLHKVLAVPQPLFFHIRFEPACYVSLENSCGVFMSISFVGRVGGGTDGFLTPSLPVPPRVRRHVSQRFLDASARFRKFRVPSVLVLLF